ncbi:MAG: NAD(P)/FAD-dependent oxidoreductase [Patescibacteria group bacterium]
MKYKEYDVIVIGAGPAGLATATGLGKSDLRVLVLEKNKQIGPKICAGGLTTKIENIGMDLRMADVLFSQIKINVPGQSVVVEMEQPFVATIDRGKLGQTMLTQVSEKVEIVAGVKVDEIGDDWIQIDGQRLTYKYLVGADGSNSLARQYLDLAIKKSILGLQYIVPKKYDELELFFAAEYFNNGYAWIFPHRHFTSIGCGRLLGDGPSHQLMSDFSAWLNKRQIDVSRGWLEGWSINYDYQGHDFGRIFLVGDAAGFTSGMTGEGIYFAVVSGQEVARKILHPDYQYDEIKKILAVKRKQEWFLSATKYLNQPLLNGFYRLFPWFFSNDYLKRRAINLFC